MIYILTGNDTKNKNAYLKKLCKDKSVIFLSEAEKTKETLFDYSGAVSLFGDLNVIVIEDLIKERIVVLGPEDLSILNESETAFVFLEEKLLAPDVKKYTKYAKIQDFTSQTIKKIPKINVFNIAEAYARRDKINTWILYREAVSLGVAPEEISGILFWKIKTLLLYGTKSFKTDELKSRSSELVDIYHKAHRGDCDFTIGLEQFILNSLSK